MPVRSLSLLALVLGLASAAPAQTAKGGGAWFDIGLQRDALAEDDPSLVGYLFGGEYRTGLLVFRGELGGRGRRSRPD